MFCDTIKYDGFWNIDINYISFLLFSVPEPYKCRKYYCIHMGVGSTEPVCVCVGGCFPFTVSGDVYIRLTHVFSVDTPFCNILYLYTCKQLIVR